MRARIAFVALLLASPIASAAEISESRKKESGFARMSPELQAMQRDDTANPGMLWVQDGAELWAATPPSGKLACGGCHGEAATSMRGVAVRYPAWDARTGAPLDLEGRINQCRTLRQDMPALAEEGPELLGVTAFVATQSRGQPIAPPDDPRLDPARAVGRGLFEGRMGQLGLSCAACHDANAGRHLGAALVPQGQPTGYPLYRLEWQGLGSLQRRMRNCLTGMRAQPLPAGSPEAVALELHLMRRAAGLPLETPAVRP